MGSRIMVDTGAPKPSRLRRLPRGIAMVAVWLVIALALSEIAFRELFLEHTVPRDEAGFEKWVSSRWPHPITPDKPPGTVRIIGLSDSFGEAGGAKNFYHLLERLLREQGVRAEVVNLSVGEYDLPDELAMLQRWGARFEPDLVVHGLFTGNDFWVIPGTLVTYGGLSVRHRSVLRYPGLRSLTLLVWLRHYQRAVAAAAAARNQGPAAPEEEPGTFSTAEFLRIERDRMVHCLPEPGEQRWAAVAEHLQAIRTASEGMGAHYVMAVLPDQYQVEEPLREQVTEAYGLDLAQYDFELPQRYLSGLCDQMGVTCIDPLPVLRAAGSGGGLYRSRDTHFNDEGNRIVAEELLQHLLARETEVMARGR